MQWTFFEVATLVAVCSTLKKGLNSSNLLIGGLTAAFQLIFNHNQIVLSHSSSGSPCICSAKMMSSLLIESRLARQRCTVQLLFYQV